MDLLDNGGGCGGHADVDGDDHGDGHGVFFNMKFQTMIKKNCIASSIFFLY